MVAFFKAVKKVPIKSQDSITCTFAISKICQNSKTNKIKKGAETIIQVIAKIDECRRNDFKVADNRAVSEIDLWTDGIHLIESGKHIIQNYLINSLNDFLEFMYLVSWYLYVKIPFCLKKLAQVI